jgi:hypothetical protein
MLADRSLYPEHVVLWSLSLVLPGEQSQSTTTVTWNSAQCHLMTECDTTLGRIGAALPMGEGLEAAGMLRSACSTPV